MLEGCPYCQDKGYVRIANEPVTLDEEDYHLESCPRGCYVVRRYLRGLGFKT